MHDLLNSAGGRWGARGKKQGMWKFSGLCALALAFWVVRQTYGQAKKLVSLALNEGCAFGWRTYQHHKKYARISRINALCERYSTPLCRCHFLLTLFSYYNARQGVAQTGNRGCSTDYLQKLGKLVYNIGKRKKMNPQTLFRAGRASPLQRRRLRVFAGV